ncbi:MAG: hypothetical protein K5696_05340 [Lachnospiraceae bacterium]|nr:hypothetical protein [Lachnospiraceae bacterium]
MKKVLIVLLILCGVFFLILLFTPDEEESFNGERPGNQTVGTSQEHAQEHVEEEKEETAAAEHLGSAGAPNANVETVSVGTDAKSATIMIYMNGSDLESKAGEATRDISEMISSGIGKNVNVIIQTMGTRSWQDYDISGSTAQTWQIKDGKLALIRDNLGQLDCTREQTLSEFIGFCGSSYPAERYLFVFWDHGGGPVYGFGYDEWQGEEESLTIAEMSRAFAKHPEIHFDIIGMDCCIMASLETCCALAPYCRYTLLSEDFESGLGWCYRGWMERLEETPGMSTPLLGKHIVDSIIEENEENPEGDSACLAMFNESTAQNLFTAWKAFAYRNEDALMNKNYSRKHMAKGRSQKGFWDFWGLDGSNVTLSDYYISDILALVESIDNESEAAKNLVSTLKAAVTCYGHTSDKNELTGMSVSLPYGDDEFYGKLKQVYTELDFDKEYIEWLEGFVSESDYDSFFDFSFFEDLWNGWGTYESQYGCNVSGGSCEYGYDYATGDYYGYGGQDAGEYNDDWIYDFEEDIWYLYEDDTLYLYDEESDLLCYYDEEEDEIYYYDEDRDDWVRME